MPKHATTAPAKARESLRFQPRVECLEDRTIPGNMLLGPVGFLNPSSLMPSVAGAAGAAATAMPQMTASAARLREAIWHNAAQQFAGQRAQTVAATQFGTATGFGGTSGVGVPAASYESVLGALPTDQIGASAGVTQQVASVLASRSSFTTFADSPQQTTVSWGVPQVQGNVAGQSNGSKEWSHWLAVSNPELMARAFSATTFSGASAGGGGMTPGAGGALDNYGTVGTPQWFVTLKPGVNSFLWAPAVGAVHRQAAFTANTFVWEFPAAMSRDEMVARLNAHPHVTGFQQVVKYNLASNFVPNDPLYPFQWHLKNNGMFGGLPGADANVETAWNSVRGRGVTIAVLDDGVEHWHRDLQQNYDFVNDFDYVLGIPDGAPKEDDEAHGTSVAGVAAARGNNFIGVSGAAPEARVTGLRILGGASTLGIANALTRAPNVIGIYNNSWGLSVGYIFGFQDLGQWMGAMEQGVRFGRGGLGSIYVWSAGNSHESNDWDANFMAPNNSPYGISVGSISNFGTKSGYSQEGVNLLVSAPSNGGTLGIVTTARSGEGGEYTFDFGGTSSAAPLVSGVIALMLEANPLLGYRDVQEILARTAVKVDPSDPGWFNNGIGLSYNRKFGFGMINATAAVNMARTWVNRPQEQIISAFRTVNQDIPDFNDAGVTSSVFVPQNFTVNRVAVTVDVDYLQRGDIEITLTSPSGVKSLLTRPFFDPDPDTAIHTLPFQRWTYTSAVHLGEQGHGEWKVTVADKVPGLVGEFRNYSIDFYGYQGTGGGGGGGGGIGGGDVSNDFKYEPNDTSDRAFPLGYVSSPMTINNLGIVTKRTLDRDWFRFTPTENGPASISIDMHQGAGDLDVRLYRRLPNGTFNQVGAGLTRQAGGTETIEFHAHRFQTYFIWIYGFQGARGAYDLNINVGEEMT